MKHEKAQRAPLKFSDLGVGDLFSFYDDASRTYVKLSKSSAVSLLVPRVHGYTAHPVSSARVMRERMLPEWRSALQRLGLWN